MPDEITKTDDDTDVKNSAIPKLDKANKLAIELVRRGITIDQSGEKDEQIIRLVRIRLMNCLGDKGPINRIIRQAIEEDAELFGIETSDFTTREEDNGHNEFTFVVSANAKFAGQSAAISIEWKDYYQTEVLFKSENSSITEAFSIMFNKLGYKIYSDARGDRFTVRGY